MGFFSTLFDIFQAIVGSSGKKDEGQQQPPQQPPTWHRPPVTYQPQPQPQQRPPKPQRPQQYPYPQPEQQKPSKLDPIRVEDDVPAQAELHYQQLRARAREKGDAMAKAFDESRAAYGRREGAEAKNLSNEGKRHKAEMERLNQEASDWIFQQVNIDSAPDEVDLHGQYVKEAIVKTESAILAAQRRGDTQIRIIVGKGLHSQGNVAKLKPAIEELMVKYQLNASIDPRNAGVLVVQLGGRGEHGMDPSEVTRRLESDERCVVM